MARHPVRPRVSGTQVGQVQSLVTVGFEVGLRMLLVARVLRSLANLRFRVLNLATIQNISAEAFGPLLDQLLASGWNVRSKYAGFDAGIDYDHLLLRKRADTLKCEWDNWSEWSIEGKRHVVEEIADRSELPVTYASRWADVR